MLVIVYTTNRDAGRPGFRRSGSDAELAGLPGWVSAEIQLCARPTNKVSVALAARHTHNHRWARLSLTSSSQPRASPPGTPLGLCLGPVSIVQRVVCDWWPWLIKSLGAPPTVALQPPPLDCCSSPPAPKVGQQASLRPTPRCLTSWPRSLGPCTARMVRISVAAALPGRRSARPGSASGRCRQCRQRLPAPLPFHPFTLQSSARQLRC